MGLAKSHRYKAPTAISYGTNGTQYLDSGVTATFGNPTNIVLDGGAYNAAGYYTLFDWSAGGTIAGGAGALTNLSFSFANWLTTIEQVVSSLTYDSANSRITMLLKSDANNGTQYVEGDLTINPTMTMILDAALYATPQTYVLFDATGTITPGSEANIVFVVQKPGLIVSACYIDGKQIKLTLSAA